MMERPTVCLHDAFQPCNCCRAASETVTVRSDLDQYT